MTNADLSHIARDDRAVAAQGARKRMLASWVKTHQPSLALEQLNVAGRVIAANRESAGKLRSAIDDQFNVARHIERPRNPLDDLTISGGPTPDDWAQLSEDIDARNAEREARELARVEREERTLAAQEAMLAAMQTMASDIRWLVTDAKRGRWRKHAILISTVIAAVFAVATYFAAT